MIRLKNLERSYKSPAGQFWVLRRVNLEIREGEFITIMGPSGAGKSSLLNALALLDDAWDGEYWFREAAVHRMKRKERAELAKRNIGMVFQSYHLLDDLTVQENIDLPLSYKDIPRDQRQSMVADTLDRFQIVPKKIFFPDSSPAASSNSSVLPVRSFINRRCCSPMNQPEICIRHMPMKSCNCSANSITKEPRLSRSPIRKPMPRSARVPFRSATAGSSATLQILN